MAKMKLRARERNLAKMKAGKRRKAKISGVKAARKRTAQAKKNTK